MKQLKLEIYFWICQIIDEFKNIKKYEEIKTLYKE